MASQDHSENLVLHTTTAGARDILAQIQSSPVLHISESFRVGGQVTSYADIPSEGRMVIFFGPIRLTVHYSTNNPS
jgi:hypothetical protein